MRGAWEGAHRIIAQKWTWPRLQQQAARSCALGRCVLKRDIGSATAAAINSRLTGGVRGGAAGELRGVGAAGPHPVGGGVPAHPGDRPGRPAGAHHHHQEGFHHLRAGALRASANAWALVCTLQGDSISAPQSLMLLQRCRSSPPPCFTSQLMRHAHLPNDAWIDLTRVSGRTSCRGVLTWGVRRTGVDATSKNCYFPPSDCHCELVIAATAHVRRSGHSACLAGCPFKLLVRTGAIAVSMSATARPSPSVPQHNWRVACSSC